MFAGTMIDELIQSVERAEKHARDEQKKNFAVTDFPVYQQQNNWKESFEVA